MPTDFEFSPGIDEVLAHAALAKLLRAYARGVDRADAGLLAQIFHPDAEVVTGVVDCKGRDFPERITRFVLENNDRTSHAVVSEWFEVHGADAIGESYVIAVSTSGGVQTLVGGRYLNRFRRQDGHWWIMSHTFVLDYTGVLPIPAEQGEMLRAMRHTGCFGLDDPASRFWAAR